MIAGYILAVSLCGGAACEYEPVADGVPDILTLAECQAEQKVWEQRYPREVFDCAPVITKENNSDREYKDNAGGPSQHIDGKYRKG